MKPATKPQIVAALKRGGVNMATVTVEHGEVNIAPIMAGAEHGHPEYDANQRLAVEALSPLGVTVRRHYYECGTLSLNRNREVVPVDYEGGAYNGASFPIY